MAYLEEASYGPNLGREAVEVIRVERVGAVLKDLDGGELLRTRLAEARAMEAWVEIVGTLLAQRTRPLRLAGTRLFVLCHGSALRQELSYHMREILRKFNKAAGLPGAARELVLLESDARLSSLVNEAEMLARREREVAQRAGKTTGPPAEEIVGRDSRIAASYPRFDGEAYRREMQRIAANEKAASGKA